MWSKIKSFFKLCTSFPPVPIDPSLDPMYHVFLPREILSEPVSMGPPPEPEMSWNAETVEIPIKLYQDLSSYILERLELGIHPNEVEFDIVDTIADIIDQYCVDENGNRVPYKG